jgi:hypothetical protein
MTKHINILMYLGIILMLGLSACNQAGVESPTASLTATTPKTTLSLATPYAQEPAAGICGSFEGEMVTVTLNPDIPDPRCSKVRPEQKLTVINQTQNTLQVSIGSFTTSLEPGTSTIIDTPFGEYLAQGVHQLQVTPCCGPELWLEAK